MWCCSNTGYEEFDTASEPYLLPLKITVVGDVAVGKTCLIESYTKNKFLQEYEPTVFDNCEYNVSVNDQNYYLLLWDTAGNEEYDRLRPLSYINTQCYFLCYSIASRKSYENITLNWLPEVRHFSPEVPIILVGTKSDLRMSWSDNFLTTQDGELLKNKIHAYAFVECSAKTEENIQKVFYEAIQSIKKKKPNKRNCCRVL